MITRKSRIATPANKNVARIEDAQITSAPSGGPTAKPAFPITRHRPNASVRRSGSTTSATYAPAAGSKTPLKMLHAAVTTITSQNSETNANPAAEKPAPARPTIITGRRPIRSARTPPSGWPARLTTAQTSIITPAWVGVIPTGPVR
jgi:hypothetical protein